MIGLTDSDSVGCWSETDCVGVVVCCSWNERCTVHTRTWTRLCQSCLYIDCLPHAHLSQLSFQFLMTSSPGLAVTSHRSTPCTWPFKSLYRN